VLQRLRLTLSETVAPDKNPVTSSIGAVTFPTVPDSLEDMIRSADSSMYAAKSAGKNRLHHQVAGEDGGERPSPTTRRAEYPGYPAG
jgi:GGDEF domain-containing protein